MVALEALDGITAHRSNADGGECVRQLAAAWCAVGNRQVAGVYVVDNDVWLWLERLRLSLSHVPAALLPDRVPRDGLPRRVVWLRSVSTPHPPDCRCESAGEQWVTCRCCNADQRIAYRCTDELAVSKGNPFPRQHNGD
ncbi:hypothetical protein EKO23_15265 [Nocardioides guangzhouensis]|uniref:Uncharacterized protein n=1 Tax=Nocardioides guangzhouensis TaxID=2497878 RepID=A0A4Q4ZBF1_9ACTN|nr:hypothetical protein [Nocardioides guangzhouensis]RYP84621.1 hypothetical protein EKO23_15265 [Nocardioides guangzhouensis]